MSIPKMLKAFRSYQETRGSKRAAYMKSFETRMIYRTTKTENPETTPLLVKQVLRKYKPV